MHKKLGEQHNLAVPRNLVHDVMGLVDPEGLERHENVWKKKRRRGATGTCTSLVRVFQCFVCIFLSWAIAARQELC